jgi:hypothetical protein
VSPDASPRFADSCLLVASLHGHPSVHTHLWGLHRSNKDTGEIELGLPQQPVATEFSFERLSPIMLMF